MGLVHHGNTQPQMDQEEHTHVDGSGFKKVVVKETIPTSPFSNNASLTLVYLDGDLIRIEKTIGATTYTKTFTYDEGELIGVSVWS